MLWLLLLALACRALADCPQFCECKWRSGKESAICRGANLTTLPKQLDAGTQLLDLTGNAITSLTRDHFFKAGLVNLQKVYLPRCRLSSIDRLAFRKLINLVELDLSYNELRAVPSQALESIPELRELRLSGNPIQRLPAEAFAKVPQLVRLELSDCKITTVEPRAFSGLERSLETLKLDGNRLTSLRPEAFAGLQSLHGIKLDRNPWNCSCSLRPFRNWMVHKNVPSDSPPTCASPARLAGRLWDRLELDDLACAPRVRALQGAASGQEGGNVTLGCGVQGVPAPAVRWLLRGRALANLTAAAPLAVPKKLFLVATAANSSNLTVVALETQDAGVYVCTAENRAGRVEASVALTVSRRPVDATPLSGKVLVASVVVAVLFVVTTCLVALCLWSLRKRHSLWVEQTRGARLAGLRVTRHDDRYEKIEMNHRKPHAPSPPAHATLTTNHTTCNSSPAGGDLVELTTVPHRRGSRRGRYRGLPLCDDDEVGYDGEVETPTVGNAGITWTATHRSSDDTISSSNPSDSRGGGLSQDTRLGLGPAPGLAAREGEAPARSLPQHVLRKQVLGDSGGSLYTSLLGDEAYPDLLRPQADSLPPSLSGSTLGGLGGALGLIGGTLPRRPHQRPHHRRGSESPLLVDSRYGSSGGSSSSGLGLYPASYQRSSSSLNLSSPVATSGRGSAAPRAGRRNPSLPTSPNRETPILSALTGSSRYAGQPPLVSPSSYEYHAAQLDRFLEEYRTLHNELSKMKETCESLRHSDAGATNPKSILKKNKPSPRSPGPGPEPPYWVPRSGLARRYSGGEFYPS